MRHSVPGTVFHRLSQTLQRYTTQQWPALMCVVLILAVHCTYIANGFVWLDHGDIEQGRAIIPLSKPWLAFVNSYASTGFYRPYVTLLHSIDAFVYGHHAWGFHITNILLHCAAACTAPLFIGSFFSLSRRERYAAAIIFGLHPLALLPAGCISFRSESLLACFTFLAVWAYGKARITPRVSWLALLFCMTLCACFSKETAFFYLLSFFCIWELRHIMLPVHTMQGKLSQKFMHADWQAKVGRWVIKSLPAILTAAAALCSVFFLRLQAMQVQWCISPVHLSLQEHIGTRLAVLGKHCVNLISPLQPSLSDATTIIGTQHTLPILMVLCLCLLFIAAIRKNIPFHLTTMLLLIAVSLLPALSILPLPRFYSPHYAYLAVAPTAGCVILIIRMWGRRSNQTTSNTLWILLACWITIAAVTTMSAGHRFESDETLFAPEVASDARFSEGWFYLGNYHLAKGEMREAWDAYDKGLYHTSGYIALRDEPEFLLNQSFVAAQCNDFHSADSVIRIAQKCSPAGMQPDIAYIRAYIAAQLGEYDTVITLLNGKEENLQRSESCRLLADALSQCNRKKEAEAMYRRQLDLEKQDSH
jgi:hypothetical protein